MARLDVRLDDEQRRRLDEIVEDSGRPISEVVRGLIDEAYEAVMRERRREARGVWQRWKSTTHRNLRS